MRKTNVAIDLIAGGVHAAEAAEATSLKALMQLHAHSSAKQRPGRDKRLIRTLLQDSKDTLLQSLSVTAQTGLHNTTSQLTALHCLAAVQESVPAPVAALAAVDAPPGFAPKAVEPSPQLQPAFALWLWPFGNGLPQEADANQWPVEDPQPLLQLLRVHKVLASKGKQEVPQQLLLNAVQSAAASGNHCLANRLIADNAANSKDRDGLLSLKLHLLKFQPECSSRSVDSTSASGQLWNLVKPLLERNPPSAETEPASLQHKHFCSWLSGAKLHHLINRAARLITPSKTLGSNPKSFTASRSLWTVLQAHSHTCPQMLLIKLSVWEQQ